MSPSPVGPDLGVYEAAAAEKGHHTIGLIHVTCQLNNGLVTPYAAAPPARRARRISAR